MPLTPEDIRQKWFKAIYKRGYDPEDVDAFLAQVADDYSALVQKMAESIPQKGSPRRYRRCCASHESRSCGSAKWHASRPTTSWPMPTNKPMS
jgi:DivIVA domain-containing protein